MSHLIKYLKVKFQQWRYVSTDERQEHYIFIQCTVLSFVF